MMQLRDYQTQAVQSVYQYFASGNKGNPLVVLPTGAGKSICIADLMKSAMDMDREQRFIMVTHVKELIEQNHEKMMTLWPHAPAGIYSASVGQRKPHMPIVFAGIQSIYKKAHIFGHRDLMIIDECHLLSNQAEGRYHTFIQAMLEINPKMKIIGFTATPYRMKGGHLTNGEIFTDVSYNYPVYKLIERGYLSPVVTTVPEVAQADLSHVRTVAGEYNQRQMQSAFMDDDVTARALNDVFSRITNHKCFLFFCAGVDHAYQTHELLKKRGLRGGVVSDKTPMGERESLIDALRNKRIDYLCNNAVLTTGTDIPRIDCVVLLRATKSRGLYVQMVGRGMRIHSEKTHCLLLDYGRNVERFGEIDKQPVDKKTIDSETSRDAPFKLCKPDNIIDPIRHKPCYKTNFPKATECEHCGAEFILPELHGDIAAQGNVISLPKTEIKEAEVTDITFHKHVGKESGKATMCITYYGNNKVLCREYMGLKRAYHRLEKWCDDKWGNPQSIEQMVTWMSNGVGVTYPTKIKMIKKPNSKHWEVFAYDFTGKQALPYGSAERSHADNRSAAR